MNDMTESALAAEFDNLLHSIEGLVGFTDPKEKSDNSHRLLGTLFGIVGKLNQLMQGEFESPKVSKETTSSDTLSNLDQWIQKIKDALSQLASFLGAQSYTIQFGVPLGISVAITFTP